MQINLQGKWEQYVKVAPVGSAVIGVVNTERGKEGALIRFERSGIYVLMRGDSASTLDQLQVGASLEALRKQSEGIS